MQEPVHFQVQVAWEKTEDSPIFFTNQMLIQHVRNEFILTFGYMTPPVFLRAPSKEEVDAVGTVPIRPIVRLGMTPDRLLELIQILQKNYRVYQASIAKVQGLEPEGGEV